MAPLGLTRSQWWVLNHLYFNEGISQTEFASVLDIEKATVGRLLDRLEAKGWVARKSDAQDKRTKRVYLTKKVQPTLQIMRDMAAVTRDEAVRSLNKTERKQLRNMLKRIRDDLSEVTNTNSTSELA
ncbi:MAG: MarR family transcriptional regulator [Rhizobiales bacterium]|nr:MarR family transcriptional regulator [Hyphomicrobiales bacterium]